LVIGLSAVDDEACGDLHILVKIYYILLYVVFAVCTLLFCVALFYAFKNK
jgi:hypothetical protein